MIRLVSVEPEHQASFEEARADIEPMVQRSLENEIVESLVDSLKDVYPYEVDIGALSPFWSSADSP